MKQIILIILIAMKTSILMAQIEKDGGFQIVGKIRNSKLEPLSGVTVVAVTNIGLNKPITVISNNEGSYRLSVPDTGTYYLSFSHIGYIKVEDYQVVINNPTNLVDDLFLETNSDSLRQVVVEGRRAMIQYKLDRVVVNVGAMASSTGSNAFDILENIPNLTIDDNGAISLKGKSGVMVYVDNRPTYLSGSDLSNYLKTLSAEGISEMEIISHPPAYYESNGKAGIINIITKKIKVRGHNINLVSSVAKGQRWKSDPALSINLRSRKVILFANIGYSLLNNFYKSDRLREYPKTDTNFFQYQQYYHELSDKKSYSGRIGLDLFLTDKTTITALASGFVRKYHESGDYNSKFLNTSLNADSTLKVKSSLEDPWNNINLAFIARHQIDKNQEFTFDLGYLRYTSQRNQILDNKLYDSNDSFRHQDIMLSHQPYNVSIYTAKTLYSLSLEPISTKIDAGFQINRSKSFNDAHYSIVVDGNENPDFYRSNKFEYKEDILAGFISLATKFKSISFQLGMRTEHTNSTGHLFANPVKRDSTFDRRYTNFFPSAHVSIDLDSNISKIIFAYSKRINRPYYEDLNPSIFFFDKLSLYSGNRYLQPELIHNVEGSYVYKDNLSAGLSVSHSKNVITQGYQQIGDTLLSQPVNIASNTIIGLNIGGSVDLFNWWSGYFYGELVNDSFKGNIDNVGNVNTDLMYFRVSVNNQWKLPGKISADMTLLYKSKSVQGQVRVSPFWFLNLGLRKNLLKDKLTIGMTVKDVFYSRVVTRQLQEVRGIKTSFTNASDTRVVGLSATLRFGNRKHSSSTKDNLENEKGRIKNN